MYPGEVSLSHLREFLNGYEAALFDFQVPYERVGVWRQPARGLPDFHTWVRRKLGFNANFGYHQSILKHTNGAEVAAWDLFWVLLDEYRALEVEIDGA